jgi:isoleucyl-tRNA synthetase
MSAAAEVGRDYKETLFLPETDFPMRAGLPQREPEILARWAAQNLYAQARADGAARPKFVFHDGPPYANGNLHIGHALNNILKDFVVRSRQMTGWDCDFVPGWDCHGLPIEWKVEEAFRAQGRKKAEIPAAEFRDACRAYAAEWVGLQSTQRQRFGMLADFAAPYVTMSHHAEAAIAAEFLKVVEAGLVYRGSKPVMWSPVERTSLAEAEVEYQEKTSTTIWVKFPLGDASVVIWTTTPWTIPGNRAISYGPGIAYGLYEVQSLEQGLAFEPWVRPGERLVIADALAQEVLRAAKAATWTRTADFNPEGRACRHPLHGRGYDFAVPLLAGDHVTDDAGTGFVHTAPGHGADDYTVWMASGRSHADIPFTVDEDGRFTQEAPGFQGLEVLKLEGKDAGKDGPANKAVIDALIAAGALLARGVLKHQYPHSWRSNAPLIFRNTPQWFIALDRPFGAAGKTLRQTALAAIDAIDWGHEAAKNRIRGMVETRPDWLISRQRAWGVPLPLFVHMETGAILRDAAVNARILAAMRAGGADAWFGCDAQALLGAEHDAAAYEKVSDILDVWFDSGSTHAFVLESRPTLPRPASLYFEGSDQHRGWFQSSLLESCATRGAAPYRAARTHGFTLDEQGRKMSKSLGNVVDPLALIEKSGADVLRMLIASLDYADDQRIGPTVIEQAGESYRKLRNTLRYLLGALNGFTEAERLAPAADWPLLERFLLHRLAEVDHAVRAGFEALDFRSALGAVQEFCINDLSAFYVDVRKDSLYCDAPTAMRRRACRSALALTFERLSAWLAPFLPFTAEEAWAHRHGAEAASVHLRQLPDTPPDWRDPFLAERMEQLRRVRRVVTGALEVERREKRMGSSLEAAVIIYLHDAAVQEAAAGVDLAELCITSAARVETGEGPQQAFRLSDCPGVAVEVARAQGRRCARSWKVAEDVGADPRYPDLSPRDAEAVARWDAVHDRLAS